jgi:hypothetical protein
MKTAGASADLDIWQAAEIAAGIKELDEAEVIGHAEVSRWLRSWGTVSEKMNAPLRRGARFSVPARASGRPSPAN